MKFVCKCGYRFEADKARVCPYCGEKEISLEKDADELVNENSNLE